MMNEVRELSISETEEVTGGWQYGPPNRPRDPLKPLKGGGSFRDPSSRTKPFSYAEPVWVDETSAEWLDRMRKGG